MILAAYWYHTLLGIFFAVVCVLLMAVILLQRGRGVGLSGAFGGAGGTSSAFGSKTGDVLTWVTIVGAIIMLTFAVLLNYVFRPIGPGLSRVAPPPSPTRGAPVGGTTAIPIDPGTSTPTPVAPASATPANNEASPATTPEPAPAPPAEAPAAEPPAQPDGGGAWDTTHPGWLIELASVQIFGEPQV